MEDDLPNHLMAGANGLFMISSLAFFLRHLLLKSTWRAAAFAAAEF
jgi:hypothetical protein